MRKNIKRIIVSGNLLSLSLFCHGIIPDFSTYSPPKKVNLSVYCVWLFSYLPQQIRGD